MSEETPFKSRTAKSPSFSKLPIVKSEVSIHHFCHKQISRFLAILNIAKHSCQLV